MTWEDSHATKSARENATWSSHRNEISYFKASKGEIISICQLWEWLLTGAGKNGMPKTHWWLYERIPAKSWEIDMSFKETGEKMSGLKAVSAQGSIWEAIHSCLSKDNLIAQRTVKDFFFQRTFVNCNTVNLHVNYSPYLF